MMFKEEQKSIVFVLNSCAKWFHGSNVQGSKNTKHFVW